MTKYYFDTSIWRDYYENREDNFRPLGEWALTLIKVIEEEGGQIFYSDLIIDELTEAYTSEQIQEILEMYQCITKVNINSKQLEEAKILGKVRKVGKSDALHAILSRDNGAILITRDNHFQDLTDIAIIKKPEEVI